MSDPIIITVSDPGYQWGHWLYAGIVSGVLLLALFVILVLSRLASTWESASRFSVLTPVLFFVFCVSLVVGVGTCAIVSDVAYHGITSDGKKDALSDLGYSRIEFDIEDRNVFVASRDGKYVEGFVVELKPLTWQVFELAIPSNPE